MRVQGTLLSTLSPRKMALPRAGLVCTQLRKDDGSRVLSRLVSAVKSAEVADSLTRVSTEWAPGHPECRPSCEHILWLSLDAQGAAGPPGGSPCSPAKHRRSADSASKKAHFNLCQTVFS